MQERVIYRYQRAGSGESQAIKINERRSEAVRGKSNRASKAHDRDKSGSKANQGGTAGESTSRPCNKMYCYRDEMFFIY